MQTIVISFGGSVIGELNTEYLQKVSKLLNSFYRQYQLYIVVGGGKLAREYIKICRELGLNEMSLDKVGITATQLNAWVLISALKYANPYPAQTIDDAVIFGKIYPVVVMGGAHPGQTTDSVSMLIAETTNANRVIIATDVDGIYDNDPKKVKNAKRFKKLTFEQLGSIVSDSASYAGTNIVIDLVAVKIIQRARIPVYVVNGRDINTLKNAIINRKFNGTKVI